MNCVIISFSSRKNGNCGKIGNFIQESIEESIHFSFSDFQIQPCGSCEGECFRSREACPHYHDMEKTLVDAICSSDMTYFVLPNHCDFPCANFFIFNERSQCCFQGNPAYLDCYLRIHKKFIVVSNSKSPYFREVFLQHSCGEPDILFISAKKYGKVSISGDILASEQAESTLRNFLSRK